MSRLAQKLREAREAACFSIEGMAQLLGLVPDNLRALEDGSQIPDSPTLRNYAMLFGTRVPGFLAHGAAHSPATLLFRSAAEHCAPLSEELGAEDLRLLGDFLACAADAHNLERALGLPEPVQISIAPPDQTRPDWEQGRECARCVREQLGLGDEPILSMCELLEQRLRWSLFFVTPDDLSAAVDGASTSDPKPAILINLVGGRETWWRTRMSLAHEMCHILVDARILAQPYLLSPHGRFQARNWALVERFQSIEARANAFAAYLLVPGPGLREAVGRVSPDSNDAINRVCRTFGVGRRVAVNRLAHEYCLSDSIVERMIARGGGVHHDADHPDAALIPVLRTETLRRLVTQALDAGLIDGLEARSILKIPTTEPIIEPIMGTSVHAPLVRSENVARARAEAHIWEVQRMPCVTTGVSQTADGWNVEVEVYGVDGVSRQVVRLSPDFEPALGSERT